MVNIDIDPKEHKRLKILVAQEEFKSYSEAIKELIDLWKSIP